MDLELNCTNSIFFPLLLCISFYVFFCTWCMLSAFVTAHIISFIGAINPGLFFFVCVPFSSILYALPRVGVGEKCVSRTYRFYRRTFESGVRRYLWCGKDSGGRISLPFVGDNLFFLAQDIITTLGTLLSANLDTV